MKTRRQVLLGMTAVLTTGGAIGKQMTEIPRHINKRFSCEKIVVADDFTTYMHCEFDRCTLILTSDLICFQSCLFMGCVIERADPWPEKNWVFAHCKFVGCIMLNQDVPFGELRTTLPFRDSSWEPGIPPRGPCLDRVSRMI